MPTRQRRRARLRRASRGDQRERLWAAGRGRPGQPAAWRPADDDDAINLISVAGLPVLKRALPVLGAVLAAALVVLGLRRRRRRG